MTISILIFTTLILSTFILSIGLYLKRLNHEFRKRFKTADGSKLDDKVYVVPGKTIFGNNFDILGSSREDIFYWCRELYERSKGKPYLLNFYKTSVYCITSPEDVQEVFQSQSLITKGVIYKLLRPFLGNGLLLSSDQLWHTRRKLLTPAFHFNILQSFIEVFKNESSKLVRLLQPQIDQIVNLNDIIQQFTLNSVCETALGVSLDDIPDSMEYRKVIHNLELVMVERVSNPLLYPEIIFKTFGKHAQFYKDLKIAHDFSSKIIRKKREEFRAKKITTEVVDETGKRQRHAMLDTLLDAESKGIIDFQDICDEVNTFMFGGFDTTSSCLIFTLLNLSLHPDIQEKCYRELENFGDLATLSIYEFNQLEYLERVIKESLRLYPTAPYIARHVTQPTDLNGVILPKNTQINIHIYDIQRDERHFPDPLKFDPDRFLPENSVKRHPFAFIPFSAGSRNCIGQKFAMLEVKSMVLGFLQNFRLLPVTTLEDIRYENGLVLRTKDNVMIKLVKRDK